MDRRSIGFVPLVRKARFSRLPGASWLSPGNRAGHAPHSGASLWTGRLEYQFEIRYPPVYKLWGHTYIAYRPVCILAPRRALHQHVITVKKPNKKSSRTSGHFQGTPANRNAISKSISFASMFAGIMGVRVRAMSADVTLDMPSILRCVV